MQHHHHNDLVPDYTFKHDHSDDLHDDDGRHNNYFNGFDILYGEAHYNDCTDDNGD